MAGLSITFLGTGTSMGVPVIACSCDVCVSADERDRRLRTSVLIKSGDVNVVIDSGPDFRQQMLKCGIKHLSALVFTHEHKDHTAGMDDVRAFNFVQGKPVQIYATERVEAALRNEFHYAFAELKYPGAPEIRFNRITADKSFSVDGVPFTPIQVFHHRLPVLGFRVGDFTYITDANSIPEAEWIKITGTKTLVINALRQQHHLSHFTLSQALEIIQKVQPERAYLTHISHQMGTHETVSKQLPANVQIAWDGLVISA